MDHPRPRPAAPSAPAPHRTLFCQPCRHTGQPCGPGLALLGQLRLAIAAAGPRAGFELTGSARLEGCIRPCPVVWRASAEAGWLFGDVEPGEDVEALVDLAARCRRAEEGGRPQAPAAGPAAILVTGPGVLQ